MTTNFPVLTQLLGSYFHQPWPDEFADESAVIQAMLAAEPEAQIRGALDEISQLLDWSSDDAKLQALFAEMLGCCCGRSAGGLTHLQRLQRISLHMANAASRRHPV